MVSKKAIKNSFLNWKKQTCYLNKVAFPHDAMGWSVIVTFFHFFHIAKCSLPARCVTTSVFPSVYVVNSTAIIIQGVYKTKVLMAGVNGNTSNRR